MDKSPQTDAVDRILEQWKRERPDLDCSPMGPIGRLKRCTMLLEPRIEAAAAERAFRNAAPAAG